MKHCKDCNCKMEEWVKLTDKVEVQLAPTLIKSEKDINIPKGMRLPSYAEYALAIEKKIIPFTEDWFEYCTRDGKIRVVWLIIGTYCSNLNCGDTPIGSGGRARGVRFVRGIK